MTLYLQNQQSTVGWPEPLESTWQLLGGERVDYLAPKLPHLGLADILFMATVMNIPRAARPWGITLLMAQEQGVTIGGLVEDTARMYAKSQKEAQLDCTVQKDVWHVQRDDGQV